jgi:YesN/AraC family two-component response regulator
VVLTDVVMPVMTGTELAARVKGVRPEVPIVLMSGTSIPREGRNSAT